MSDELSAQQVRFLRMVGQHLHDPDEKPSLIDVVRSVFGINAQQTLPMMLSLRARIAGLTREDVDKAIVGTRRLVRTWAMRGTIHLLDAGDVRWLIPMLGPLFIAKGRKRRADLGLSEEIISKGLGEIRIALNGAEPMTRWELMDSLSEKGLVLDRKTQAPIHLIQYANLDGLTCMGPYRENGEPTYVLFDEWIGDKVMEAREVGSARLARRYLDGYSPASVKDFAAWSGIPAGDAKKAVNAVADTQDILEVDVNGKSMWVSREKLPLLRKPLPKHILKLLPAFDSYLLGYADRELIVPAEYRKEIYHGGQTVAALLVDGAVAGVWKYERRGRRLSVTISPFESYGDAPRDLLLEGAGDVARFLGYHSEVDINVV